MKMESVFNVHKNHPAIILGHGPSLTDDFKNRLQKLKNKSFILFGCNEWYHVYNTEPNYWVLSSWVDSIGKNFPIMNRHPSIKILYAHSVDLINKDFLDKSLDNDYLGYDQRHFNQRKCKDCDTYGCDKYLNSSTKTIQEYLKEYTNFNSHYSPGATVSLHMFAFSILMGCNPIYSIGNHYDYKIGYSKNDGNLIRKVDILEFDKYKMEILEDLNIIVKSANNVGVNIFNLDSNSDFSIIEKYDINKLGV